MNLLLIPLILVAVFMLPFAMARLEPKEAPNDRAALGRKPPAEPPV